MTADTPAWISTVRPRRPVARGLLLCAVVACSESQVPPVTSPPVVLPVVTSISVTALTSSLTTGTTLELIATPRDQQGRTMSASLSWSTSNALVAIVSPGGVVSGIGAGNANIRAQAGEVSGSVALTVNPLPDFVAGQSYSGRNGYIEYIAGNAPVILSAPHGGALLPSTIPDRVASACGGSATTVTDGNTVELVRAMQERFFARFGTYPHVVISHLSRRKLDPNRLATEAACGNREASAALEDWHLFIDAAKAAVVAKSGKGWYMDMHGHGHPIPRLELGYLLTDAQLNLTDAELDASTSFESRSSFFTLSQAAPSSFSSALRGGASLGTLYANNGFPAIPSTADPRPNGTDYFDGGDNTRRHTCGSSASALGGATNGTICGVQIETNFANVRDNAINRSRFADATAIVLEEFLRVHWGLRLTAP